ncbi:prephenate dehydratase [Tunicatimonas pelagia]|uniref:prephenate dehydratase n=1 Tax=Tunicatimonas pelagia TaxID=931531 RepID=UPI002665F92E|nr:prephenate dehydratase [Tunicatimonas pelagia]WKN40827.1 prephenate dehydratase [Tunicatimonas pelagia]
MESDKLSEYRQRIDQLDSQLLALLNERMEVVKQVGELKRSNNSIIYRPEREKAILDRLKGRNTGLLPETAIDAIFLEIFAVSRNIELPERIAYLGPNGSFTHQAAESRFGAMSEYMPVSSIRAVFKSVAAEITRFGVVPVENNQQGLVPETADCLAEYNVQIVAELPMDVHFAFVSRANKLSEVRKIYSKDIAFRQCSKFIDEVVNDSTVELIPVESTSKAARLAEQEADSAAICSRIAAQEYQVPILFENVETSGDNQTRFFIISKLFANQPSGSDKTSVLVKLPHSDEPGILADFLQAFNQANINLTKIESRPAKRGKTFTYWFFIDFEGHWLDENIQHIVNQYKEEIKWLGSYVRLI